MNGSIMPVQFHDFYQPQPSPVLRLLLIFVSLCQTQAHTRQRTWLEVQVQPHQSVQMTLTVEEDLLTIQWLLKIRWDLIKYRPVVSLNSQRTMKSGSRNGLTIPQSMVSATAWATRLPASFSMTPPKSVLIQMVSISITWNVAVLTAKMLEKSTLWLNIQKIFKRKLLYSSTSEAIWKALRSQIQIKRCQMRFKDELVASKMSST